MSNKVMVWLIVFVMVGFIVGAGLPAFFRKEKPKPRFRNGDMILHTLSEREGQVINNVYQWNSKSDCWKVQIRFKGDTEKENTLANKIVKLIDDAPLSFNEFELEKR